MNWIVTLLALTAVKAAPLIYAALGGVIAERSGVINIGLEGMLIAGAFTAVAVSYATANVLLATIGGIAAGALCGALLGLAATRWRADQIVAGTGVNLLAQGAAAFALVLIFDQPGASKEVTAYGSLGPWGPASLVALALLLPFFVHWILYGTVWGLRLRACGDHPAALAAAGVDPLRLRLAAVTISGALAGLGGVYLAIGELAIYSDGMTAGRGFIALAAVIFGRWTPLGALGACGFFGLFAALQYTLQRAGIPSELMQALPYLAALVAIAGAVGRSRPPQAEGVPYG